MGGHGTMLSIFLFCQISFKHPGILQNGDIWPKWAHCDEVSMLQKSKDFFNNELWGQNWRHFSQMAQVLWSRFGMWGRRNISNGPLNCATVCMGISRSDTSLHVGLGVVEKSGWLCAASWLNLHDLRSWTSMWLKVQNERGHWATC